MKRAGSKKGFTLVELIVVIAIIGVLAAILVPTMIGYVTSSKVTSANSTAASISKGIDGFLTEADTKGYGMMKGATANSVMEFKIDTNGTWTLSNGTTSAFKTDNVSWLGTGSGSAAQSKVPTLSAEQLLCITLADMFPTLDTAYIWAYIEGGKCKYLCFTDEVEDDTGSTMPQKTNFDSGIFSWDGQTAGITSDGYIVGTAPVLDMG